MVRAYSNVRVQLGVETTSGVTVPANRQLLGLSLDPQAVLETVQHKPSGQRFATVSAVTSEQTEADYEGPIDYNNIVYPLSSLFGPAVITPGTDTEVGTYTWTWNVTGKGSTNPVTYTVEVGDDDGASRFNNAVFSGLDLDIARSGDNTMSGSLFGRELETDAVTMTATPTEVPIVPVNGDHWDVYADDASEDIGTTKLLHVYEAGLSFGDLFSQEWTLNSANRSFNAVFDAEDPSFEWNMTIGADATANAYLATARNGGKKFIRLAATGPNIAETAVPHSINFDFAAVITDFDSYQSSDGLYALPITFAVAYDATYAKAMTISVVNGRATL